MRRSRPDCRARLTTRSSAPAAPDLSAVRKLAEIPFDFVRKRVSVVVETEGRTSLITKGAFHQVLEICTRSADGACARRRGQGAARGALSRRGAHRASGCWPSRHERWSPSLLYSRELERDLTFAGFLTFLDRPKADVADAIRSLATLGVSIKIITGDSKPVTQHVAALVGLRADRVLTGTRPQRLPDEALWRAAESTDLFVEVDPNQKERIILALKKMGHVVGFLGDGVNDAPAMHAADTSLSVEQAVDVAREAADFVLLERSLDVIRRGIEEGRKTFANTLKYVLTTMSANLGNMISMAAASLFLPFLPLLAGQILLNNFLSDVPAIGIADDAVDPELVERPQRWNMRFIGRFMVEFGAVSSVFDFLTFGALLLVFHAAPDLFRTGWFVESLLTELVDRAGRPDAAAVLSQPARPGPALVDGGAHRADLRHPLSAIHRRVRLRAVAGHAARDRDGDYGAVCRRHRTDQAAVLSGVL